MPLGKLRVFCIRYFLKTKSKPAKKITGQCFSTEREVACENSANLEQETKTTKIVTYPLFPLASSYKNLAYDLAHHESPIAEWLEHPTSIWKVMG